MKKILKGIFNEDMFLIYFVNFILADPVSISFITIMAFMLPLISEKYSYILAFIWFCVLFTILIGRLFVLPIFYKMLEESNPNEYAKNFLHKLRYSTKTKLIILFIAPFPLMIETGFKPGTSIIEYGLMAFVLSLFTGLLGSYVVLFLYWHIIDKKRKKEIEFIK